MTDMRTFLLVLWSVFAFALAAVAEKSPISISVAIPTSRDGERAVTDYGHDAHFHVVIANVSNKPQRIWQEWCSWGYFGLRFEFTDEKGKKWFAEKKPRDWIKNYPDWWTLAPYESLVLNVYFGDSEIWQGFPFPERMSQIVTMRAILEFKADDDSRKLNIWTGRVASKEEKFTFYRRTASK